MNVRVFTEDAMFFHIEISPDRSKDSSEYYLNAPGVSEYTTTQTISVMFHDIFAIWNAWNKMTDHERRWYADENSKYSMVVMPDGIHLNGGDWDRVISKRDIIDVYHAAKMVDRYRAEASKYV